MQDARNFSQEAGSLEVAKKKSLDVSTLKFSTSQRSGVEWLIVSNRRQTAKTQGTILPY